MGTAKKKAKVTGGTTTKKGNARARVRALQKARQARSEAALKGWETRRRRERERERERKKRSEAARRGWETRRRRSFVSRDILAVPSAEEAVRAAELAGIRVVRYPTPPTPLPIPPTQAPAPPPSPTPAEPFRDEKEEGWIETLVGLGYTVASPDGLAGTASLETTADALADELGRLGTFFFGLPTPAYVRVEWVETDLDQADVGALWGSDPVRLADGMTTTFTTHWHTDVGLLTDNIEPIATGAPDRPATITVAVGYSPRGVRGRKAR